MPAQSMEMPQMNMVAQPQTEQPKAEEPMSMSLRGGGMCEMCECCCACCALETICCCLGAEEVAEAVEDA